MQNNIEQLVGRMFVVGFQGTSAPDYVLEWLREGHIGGVILFARNVESPAQLAALTHSLHQAASRPILIGIDQEGGTVARLRAGFSEIPSAMALSNANDEGLCQACYAVLGTEMHALGINWDYAPVLDISYNKDNPTVGTRSFGTKASRVSRYASAAVRGLQEAGVAACAKHFPGLGNTAIDTHLALPTIDTPLAQLLQDDLAPYRAVIQQGIASLMTTHTIYATLDDQYPATLSPHVIQRLIREELRFDGVVTSDCMEMKAIADHYEAGAYAALGALAGLDVILVSHTRSVQEEAYRGLLAAVQQGRVPLSRIEEANQRIEALLARYAITQAPDLSQVNTPEHQAQVYQAARQALYYKLIKPLPEDIDEIESDDITVIEFISPLESEVLDHGGASHWKSLMLANGFGARYVPLKSSVGAGDDLMWRYAQDYAQSSALTLIVTRNAHLLPVQKERIETLMEMSDAVFLIHARNPYDAEVLPAPNSRFFSYGDAYPQLKALWNIITHPPADSDKANRRIYYNQA